MQTQIQKGYTENLFFFYNLQSDKFMSIKVHLIVYLI